jgi:hypothetical protein
MHIYHHHLSEIRIIIMILLSSDNNIFTGIGKLDSNSNLKPVEIETL